MPIKIKPTVHYDINGVARINVGDGAVISVIDHPSLNYGQMAWTSTVLEYDLITGIFETKNSIYVPMKLEGEQQ